MKFAEFVPGLVVTAGPYHVTEAEALQFARQYDPQWFHTDPDAAATKSAFGGLIASGWHTASIGMRLITDAALVGSESFASPGLAYLKWMNPVRPGDDLRIEAEVLEQRRSDSKPTLGIVRWRWRMKNQKDVQVLELEATSLFRLPAPGAA